MQNFQEHWFEKTKSSSEFYNLGIIRRTSLKYVISGTVFEKNMIEYKP